MRVKWVGRWIPSAIAWSLAYFCTTETLELMIYYRLALAALLVLGLAACKKEQEEDQHTHDHGGSGSPTALNVRFNFTHGLNAFDINGTYADGMGHAIRFSTLRFYASDFHLEDDGGATVAEFQDKVVLFDGATPNASFDLGTINGGHIHEVHFNLGLESSVNHADPLTAAYPLNIPGMHWSWNPAAGYKFLNMEGSVDGNGDGDFVDAEDLTFTYHCATDALLTADHFNLHQDANGGTLTLDAKLDVAVLLTGLDLLATPVAMGGGPNNVAAMNNLAAAIDEP